MFRLFVQQPTFGQPPETLEVYETREGARLGMWKYAAAWYAEDKLNRSVSQPKVDGQSTVLLWDGDKLPIAVYFQEE